MFVMELAGVRIRMENQYAYLEQQCRDYIVSGSNADFSVAASPAEIAEEQRNGTFSEGYCESICAYRHICDRISAYGVFLMHSSVIEVDGSAYAFAAKSGVGKSTHTALWLKNIPRARVVNGDKPLFRLEANGAITVFGTPWNGKEEWGERISAPLAAVCFLERGETNEIRTATEAETVEKLVHQLYLRGEKASVDQRLHLMNALLQAVPFYVLRCNREDDAAWTAYRAMKR